MADYRMSYDVPKEFKDEEKWFKFFTTRSAIVAIVVVFIVGIYIKILSFFGLQLFGIISGALVGGVIVGLTMIPKMGGRTLTLVGGSLAGYLLRRFIHKKNNKIYVKGIVEYQEPEDLYEKYELLKKEYEETQKKTNGSRKYL